MKFLKLIIVALSLLLGVFFVYEGLGSDLRILNYEDLGAYGIPIGVMLLVFGVVIAKFWTIA
jgi:Kef-type K+ transport system membrane component KefB